MNKANSFQIAKVQCQGVAWLLLIFLPISLLIKVFLIKKLVIAYANNQINIPVNNILHSKQSKLRNGINFGQ